MTYALRDIETSALTRTRDSQAKKKVSSPTFNVKLSNRFCISQCLGTGIALTHNYAFNSQRISNTTVRKALHDYLDFTIPVVVLLIPLYTHYAMSFGVLSTGMATI